MVRKSKSERVPKEMQPTFEAVVALTDRFCKERLNEEYVQLARQVTATLCRKRLSPLRQGQPRTWACGIIYALGFVNVLFDRSQDPHTNAGELCERFGVSKSTGSAKSKQIWDALHMRQFDPNWCLPSKLDENPLEWMITVNGLIADAQWMPREVQEIAYEKGLIPYIPGENEPN